MDHTTGVAAGVRQGDVRGLQCGRHELRRLHQPGPYLCMAAACDSRVEGIGVWLLSERVMALHDCL